MGLLQISQHWDLGILLMKKEDGIVPLGVWNAGQHVCSKINVMYDVFIRFVGFTYIVRVLSLGNVGTFRTPKQRKSAGSIVFALW